MLSDEEKEALIKEGQQRVLQVFNELLIRKGVTQAHDAIYIASMAMAQAAAVLMWSQMPLDAYTEEARAQLLEDWCNLYKGYVEEIIRKRKEGYEGEPIVLDDDEQEELAGDDEGTDTNDSAWNRKRGA